jgi:Wiskott-Aldrich syndrome protein
MFRASPWITYDPPTSESHPPQSTDNDAEMDAPQISTLHDDGESPPSNASPARTGKFRVKLPSNEAKMGTKFITFNGKTGEEAAAAEEPEEDEPDEDEEDELIDDEEDTSAPAAPGSGGAAGAPSSSSSAPAKVGTKRPSTRAKSSQTRRKARLSGPSAASSSTAPTTAPSEAKSKDVDAAPSTEASSTAPQASLAVPAPTSRKKAVPKGTTAAQRAPRKSAPK